MIRQVVKGFDQRGRYLMYLGGRGDGPGSLDFPSAVTTDGRERLYVLSRQAGELVCYGMSAEVALSLASDPVDGSERSSGSGREEETE